MMTVAERRRLAEDFAAYKENRKAVDLATRAKPVVVEIPFERAPEPNVQRCCRMHTDGRQCELPAMEPRVGCPRRDRQRSIVHSFCRRA